MEDSNKQYAARNITIGDIAEELGLSKTTVSRAISGKGRISASTKLKVQEYIREHNYKPNVIAKGLAQSKTFNIGVILPADANLTEIPFFQSCLMGICEEAANLDYDVVVTTVKEDDLTLLKRLISNQKVDGIILTRSLVNDAPARYLKEVGIPFVMIGSSEDESIVQIDSNHIAGCCELTSILLMSGCKSLAFLAGNQNHIVNRNRYEGFLKAFTDMKVGMDESMIFMDMNNKMLIDRAINTIMERHISCIVCSDDLICSRVLAKLDEENYTIPNTIKVASFYNSAHLESHNPPITALSIDVKDLGVTAAKRLIEMISGEQIIPKTWVNYEIVLKKSTK
ncbi:MAG: LacI family transcriptional regulator [Anaerocolumna sp.]|jgi:DNA-binding LacI/PurR family transcriptional regulator|nr:LacI family transcriptional regulator [Anaerocolumna sp.]